MAELLRDHSRRGPFELETVANEDVEDVRIAGLRPIPPVVSRLTADVLNNLRNVLEHTVFGAVEHDLGRPMTKSEARSIEVPSSESESAFDAWLSDKRRAGMGPLQPGSPLAVALRAIQPFAWQGSDTSPLSLLVEHTNAAKHRSPAIAQIQLGQVTPDFDAPGVEIPAPTGQPAAVGDVVASGPRGVFVGLDIWPTITILRPVSGGWKTLQAEVSYIEEWVRTNALPTLLDLAPGQTLPAAVDVRAEIDDLRQAADAANDEPAMERNMRILIAEGVVRPGMLDLLLPVCETRFEQEAVRSWIASLSDDQVIARHRRLVRASTDNRTALEACRQVIKVAVNGTRHSTT